MVVLILLFIVTTLGSLLSGLTGLAGGAVILGGLMMFFPTAESLAMHGVVQSVSNGTRVLFWWKSVHWDVVWRYTLLLIPGAFMGGLLFNHLNLHLVEAALGALILAVVWLPMPKRFGGTFTKNGFIWLGLLSGFFSMLAGVVGPLLNPFFDKLNIKRDQMVSTKSACQLILHLVRIGSYAGVVGLDLEKYGVEMVLMVIAAVLGIWLSRPVGKHITDRQLDIALKVLLTVIGSKNVVTGVSGYLM
jgi:uncharacterized protein